MSSSADSSAWPVSSPQAYQPLSCKDADVTEKSYGHLSDRVAGEASLWAADDVLLGELKSNDAVMAPDGASYRFKRITDAALWRFAPGPPPAR